MVRTERRTDREVISSALLAFSERVKDGSSNPPFFQKAEETDHIPIGGTRYDLLEKKKKEGFWERTLFALVGGGFLIGPMLLMVLHNTRVTALVSTSIAVILCGVLAAWKLTDPLSVVSVTAAYAAVLVVFIGTSGSGS